MKTKKYIKLNLIVLILSNLLILQVNAQKNTLEGDVKSTTSAIEMSDKQLLVFNRNLKIDFTDTCNNLSGQPFRILVVGGSIVYHGKMEKIGWKHNWGMAATKIENDFAHLLFKKTESIMPGKKISMRIKNLAKFDRNYLTYDFAEIDSLINFLPDLIVFEIGGNVKFTETNTPSLYKKRYLDLIKHLKNGREPIIICTNTYYNNKEKNEIIEQVALTTGSYLVDITHLSLNKNNYAKYEVNYAGDKSIWKVDGIGLHPGDYGMESLAQQVFFTINAAIKSKHSSFFEP